MTQTRDHEFWSRLGVTLVVLGAYSLGTNVPLPGLDADKVATFLRTAGSTALDRISILSLGVMPLLNALIIFEVLKLIAPGIRSWEAASPQNRNRLGLIVIGVAMLMALFQGAGVAEALEDATGLVVEPGTSFRLVCIATLMAGTAIAIAFAGIIDRLGLGSGLWLLFLAPALTGLPSTLAGLAVLNASGEYSTQSILLSIVFSAIAIAAVVSIVRAAHAAPATVATCIWTPFIANVTTFLMLFAVGGVAMLSVSGAVEVSTPGHLPWYVASAIAVALIVWLYGRSYTRAGEESPVPAAPIAATLAAILIAGTILETQFGVLLPLGAAQLIIAATVATTILIDWGYVRPAADDDASEEISPRA